MKRRLKYPLLIATVLGFTALAGASLLSAEEATEMKDMYPRLNSNVDGSPATCTLKRAEAVWLTEQMDKGNIRTATPEDIKAWEDLAKKKGRPEQKIIDCGRVYTILKPMVLNMEISGSYATFIVNADVPFPEVKVANGVYDLKTGGWFQLGQYDDGVKQGIGNFPRYDPSIYSHNK